jgi:2-phosphoglycolate phosphatase
VSPAPVEAVLFDLDGTLLDTAPDMGGALNELRAENSLEPLPAAQIRPHVSHGATALVQLGFPRATPEEFAKLRERFLVLYSQRVAVETQPFEGTLTLLEMLEQKQMPWGIVTNKPAWLTEPLLNALGLRERAGSVVSGDTFPERKPHPRPLLHAAAELGVQPHRCIFVGDAERDVRAARAAEMRALVARFGYIDATEDVAAWAADGCIDNPMQVLDWL